MNAVTFWYYVQCYYCSMFNMSCQVNFKHMSSSVMCCCLLLLKGDILSLSAWDVISPVPSSQWLLQPQSNYLYTKPLSYLDLCLYGLVILPYYSSSLSTRLKDFTCVKERNSKLHYFSEDSCQYGELTSCCEGFQEWIASAWWRRWTVGVELYCEKCAG